MDYKSIYENLLKNKSDRKKNNGVYYEKHHIIPKCIGGTDETSNLVLLTGREHYIAHRLLAKIYNEHKLICAAYYIACLDRSRMSSRSYEEVRTAFAKSQSKRMKGKRNPEESYRKGVETRKKNGYKHSKYTRQAISKTKKAQNIKLTEEQIIHRTKVRKENGNNVCSEEQKKKLSARTSAMKWMNNGKKNRRITDPEEIEKLLSTGWEFGVKSKRN